MRPLPLPQVPWIAKEPSTPRNLEDEPCGSAHTADAHIRYVCMAVQCAARLPLQSWMMSFQVSGAVCGEMLVTLAVGAAMAGGRVEMFAVLNFVTMCAGLLGCAGLTVAVRAAAALLPLPPPRPVTVPRAPAAPQISFPTASALSRFTTSADKRYADGQAKRLELKREEERKAGEAKLAVVRQKMQKAKNLDQAVDRHVRPRLPELSSRVEKAADMRDEMVGRREQLDEEVEEAELACGVMPEPKDLAKSGGGGAQTVTRARMALDAASASAAALKTDCAKAMEAADSVHAELTSLLWSEGDEESSELLLVHYPDAHKLAAPLLMRACECTAKIRECHAHASDLSPVVLAPASRCSQQR